MKNTEQNDRLMDEKAALEKSILKLVDEFMNKNSELCRELSISIN